MTGSYSPGKQQQLSADWRCSKHKNFSAKSVAGPGQLHIWVHIEFSLCDFTVAGRSSNGLKIPYIHIYGLSNLLSFGFSIICSFGLSHHHSPNPGLKMELLGDWFLNHFCLSHTVSIDPVSQTCF